jgi:hypothetical protein
MNAWIEEMKAWRKQTTACQEATEACLESKELAPEEMAKTAAHPEVPNEEAAVETIGALKDRHLTVERRRQPKKWTQIDGGSRKKLAATRRRMTRRAILASRKGHCHQGPARTMFYAEPLKDGLSKRDVGRDLSATKA